MFSSSLDQRMLTTTRTMPSPRGGLVVPGVVWGSYPLRPEEALPASRSWAWFKAWARRPDLPTQWAARRFLGQVRGTIEVWQSREGVAWDASVQSLKQALASEGLSRRQVVQSLAMMACLVQKQTGWRLHDAQLLSAWWMLHNHLVEMATGEGKSVAMVMAAGAAALSGIPVHLMTANDYLAQRDEAQWRAVYRAAGLTTSVVTAASSPLQRREAYLAGVVYVTAKEVAFDYLRDCLARQQGQLNELVLRGLCMAMIDEADSILIDEAATPLILSRSVQNQVAVQTHRLAMYLARMLHVERDFVLDAQQVPYLTAAGVSRLTQAAAALPGLWQLARYRQEQVQLALTAQHVLQANVHYLVKDQQIHIIDGTTGRLAVGRSWSRGLHQMICLKEKVPPLPETQTLMDTSFQRFFPRYHRVCGLSGTLWEERFDLMATYGLPLRRVPLTRASLRQHLGTRVCEDACSKWQWVRNRAIELSQQGRAVLVGVASVSDSQALSQCLSEAGMAHQVLNAQQDASNGEAERHVIEQAGLSHMITVATHMAGRGTDIQVATDVLEKGGLHVINTHINASTRVDRQLYGRAGRQGQPGSSECVISWSDAALQPWGRRGWHKAILTRWPILLRLVLACHQALASGHLARQRWALVQSQRGVQQQTALAGRSD
jgi:preprotein translocase subunit SecA